MNQYALVKNNVVENVIVADTVFISTITGYDAIVDVTDNAVSCKIGDSYSGGNFVAPQVVASVVTRMTRLQFQLKFTFAELVAIETAAETNPGVRVLQRQQENAEFIDLADEHTINGIMYLISIGLLTQERGTEILTP